MRSVKGGSSMTTALVKIPETTYTRKAWIDRYGHEHKAVTVTRGSYKKKVKRSRGRKRRTPKEKRFFHPKVKMNWGKNMPITERRDNALEAHGGNLLATGRALQALANVTQDAGTKVEARKDALYFFAQHEREK